MKKIIILRATGGELTNQLWNYASVYAYCLERGYALENPSFFEYGNYFTLPTPNLFLRIFFFLPFTDYTKRKQSFKRLLWRKLYEYYARILTSLHKNSVLSSDNGENKPFYLPPTEEPAEFAALERQEIMCFDGWLFRNPIGLEKYRKEIVDYFKPRPDIEQKVRTQIQKLRGEFKHIVGVHVRQGDYITWRGGAYFIPQTRVRELLDEYLQTTGHTASETCFVITSDGPVNTSLFGGLHISVSKENAVHDLFLLSSTDIVLGPNSTFGAFASYYGNIPCIVMQKGDVDWAYYQNKTKFFENKYSIFVRY